MDSIFPAQMLFWLLKCALNIAKTLSSGSHLSSVIYTSTHKWHKLFDLLTLGKGRFKRKIYTNRPQNLANFEHTACWVPNIYPEIGDQLVKSIKKVNWNTAVEHHISQYHQTLIEIKVCMNFFSYRYL